MKLCSIIAVFRKYSRAGGYLILDHGFNCVAQRASIFPSHLLTNVWARRKQTPVQAAGRHLALYRPNLAKHPPAPCLHPSPSFSGSPV